MKRVAFLLFMVLCGTLRMSSQVFTLNQKEALQPGAWICFRTTFTLDEAPDSIELRLAADSKYWLWINGSLQVYEGGLKRGPNPKDTYCDVIRNLPALQKGCNTVAVLVWYFGKDGFSHRNSPTPGMTFALSVNGRSVKPDHGWRAAVHPAYYVPEGDKPNYRLAESNIGFDASKDIDFTSAAFDDSKWTRVKCVSLKKAGWNRLVDRPIPFWKDYGLKHYQYTEMQGDTILKAWLPYNAQITPYIRLNARAGQIVRMQTDNYNGGSATNVFAEYCTRDGEQEFECRGWMNGHYVIYHIPKGVEVIDVMYRETGYDTSLAGSFNCDDQSLNRLWDKAQRTLYITMRDTYMDCPDRERAQWWGDVVNELGEAFYALDEKAHMLTRKGIRELMDWQRPDSTIFAPVPAGNYDSELPMQMLASIGYYGFWTYYMGTADRNTIEYVFPKVKKYIHVWKTDEDGLVIPRKGGWTWGDWGDNKDMYLLFNQWYVIALQGYERMAALTGHDEEAEWASATADKLRSVFHGKFWNGSYYVSPRYSGKPDDRVQALAVVSGTLPADCYAALRPFFREQYHASPYMEKYVLQALCQMGYYDDALHRMKKRYAEMTDSKLTTLWEGWGIGSKGFGGGSYNHAWSGGPLTIMSQYIAGIETVEPAFVKFKIEPHMAYLNRISAVVPLSGGREIRLKADRNASVCTVVVDVPQGTSAQFVMPDCYSRMTVNGSVCDGRSSGLTPGKWIILMYR